MVVDKEVKEEEEEEEVNLTRPESIVQMWRFLIGFQWRL